MTTKIFIKNNGGFTVSISIHMSSGSIRLCTGARTAPHLHSPAQEKKAGFSPPLQDPCLDLQIPGGNPQTSVEPYSSERLFCIPLSS